MKESRKADLVLESNSDPTFKSSFSFYNSVVILDENKTLIEKKDDNIVDTDFDSSRSSNEDIVSNSKRNSESSIHDCIFLSNPVNRNKKLNKNQKLTENQKKYLIE